MWEPATSLPGVFKSSSAVAIANIANYAVLSCADFFSISPLRACASVSACIHACVEMRRGPSVLEQQEEVLTHRVTDSTLLPQGHESPHRLALSFQTNGAGYF